MKWTDEAQKLLKDLVAEIPFLVRSLAEDTTRERAEEMAQEEARNTVEEKDVVAGYIVATPFHMRRFLKPVLEKQNIPREWWSSRLS